jgi:hypothetical protein
VLPLNQVFWIFLHNRELMKLKDSVETGPGWVSVVRDPPGPDLRSFSAT